MTYQAINFGKKLALIGEQWQPRVVAEMNDYQFKLVKLQGDFIWHDHKDTDETFIVVDGVLRIDFRDGAVRLAAGEMFVVPRERWRAYRAKRRVDLRSASGCYDPRGQHARDPVERHLKGLHAAGEGQAHMPGRAEA
jgi:mannose-6-phosphate isomerase-like protein (cupin superfamily)